jgi:hypothetical protein
MQTLPSIKKIFYPITKVGASSNCLPAETPVLASMYAIAENPLSLRN